MTKLEQIKEHWRVGQPRMPGAPLFQEETQVDWLVAEVSKLRKMLVMLEWAGASDGEEASCPACGEYEDQGHADDCWLEPELPQ